MMMIISTVNSKKIINISPLITIATTMVLIEMVKEINFKKTMNRQIQII